MSLELKPCPFCGGGAEIVQIGNEATKSRGFEVRCMTWGCTIKKRAMVIRQPIEKAREYAVAAWNQRSDAASQEGARGGEPVAWRVWCANGECFYQTEKPSAFNPAHVQPLYASPAEPSGWRPEVRAFADLMEAQLRDNDHKPGWKNDSDLDLFERLGEESAELLAALHRHAKRLSWGDHWVMEDTAPRVGREAADVANFAMMIADVCGALDPGRKALEAGRG